jgi:AcrR family transcriptional regulator
MARQTPADRLEKLLVVAAAAFVQHGFHRTQMDDIAVGLGVSKGTIYRSVDSKEALLAAVLDYADTPEHLPPGGPIEANELARVSSTLRERLTHAVSNLELAEAVTTPTGRLTAPAFAAEIERITLDLYQMMDTHRIRIMVLDRCAGEIPQLAGDWYESGRYAVVDLWIAYLRAHSKHVNPTLDPETLARTIVELITLWAVKMPWDPSPRAYPADMAHTCAVMIRNLITGAT